MIDTSHAGQHVTIAPGVVIGGRVFLPGEIGVIEQEYTHPGQDNTGYIVLVRWADGKIIPMYAFEIITSSEEVSNA